MGRSLGYYGVKMDGHEYSNRLIQDMVETWGDDLGNMSQRTTLMLIAELALKAADEVGSEFDPLFQEVAERVEELSANDAIALIQALAN
jgi:hypothetical protein